MGRRRLKMTIGLGPQEIVDAADAAGVRAARQADREPLAALLIAAYRGTVDDDGETLDDALAEIGRTLGGSYGPYLEPCSFLVEDEGRAVAASLVTRWTEAPLLAFVMVAPDFQRRGLGELVLRRSMAALWASGETELVLFVTDGNTPAQRLYERLGFVAGEPGA
ncbi:MAG TPA: GNAT family N-acetyltransferase [Chloroflexaceae bacterium]|nr:GNAT family N-acetyltransferase [Chloroflexaceae bacterium]